MNLKTVQVGDPESNSAASLWRIANSPPEDLQKTGSSPKERQTVIHLLVIKEQTIKKDVSKTGRFSKPKFFEPSFFRPGFFETGFLITPRSRAWQRTRWYPMNWVLPRLICRQTDILAKALPMTGVIKPFLEGGNDALNQTVKEAQNKRSIENTSDNN